MYRILMKMLLKPDFYNFFLKLVTILLYFDFYRLNNNEF